MTNIFLEKSYTKRGGETISRLFSNRAHFWISSLKCHTVCFYFMPSKGLFKLSCRPLAVTSNKTFFLIKKSSGTSLFASFCL